MTDSQKQILDLIFAATHQIFYDYDVASGTIQWSGQVQQVLGYSLEDMMGGVDQWMDLIHPEDRDDALRQLEIAEKAVSAYEVEYRFRRRDGEYLWMRDRGIYQGDETGKAVRMIGLQEDISDRRRAEAALRDTEERYRVLVERVQGAVFFIQEGKFVFSNEAFAKIIGYTPEEIIGRPFVEFVAPESLETVRDNYRRRVAGEDVPNEYEAYLLHKNGEHRLTIISAGQVMVQGKMGSLGTIIDITEQRRNEQALREAAERQRLILETSPTAMEITRPDGTILYANKRLASLLGVEVASLVSAQISGFYADPSDRQLVLEHIQQHGYLEDRELCFKRADGSLVWVLVSARPFNLNNEMVFLSSWMDITARKQLESELDFRSQFERLVADISTRFVSLTEDVDAEIVTTLGAIGDFSGLDRSYVFRIDEPRGVMDNTHEWCAPGITPHQQDLQGVPLDTFPWLMAQLRRRQTVYVPRVSDLPAEAGAEKSEFEREAIQSLLVVPMIYQGELHGFVGFDAVRRVRQWTEDVVRLLRTVADALAGSLERQRFDRQIEEAYARRGRQVQISTQVAQEIAAAANLEDLYHRVVTQVKEQFGYYHTQVLRYNPSLDAVELEVGYGEVGRQMVAQRHSLPMGIGLIGTAAASGQTMLRPGLKDDPDWKPNPLLSETQGEIAVPIKLGSQVLGVLDVQSSQANALSDDDRLLLEGLCGQIAIAMENTRLRQEMQMRLSELDSLSRSMSAEAWQAYRNTLAGVQGYVYDQADVQPHLEWPEALTLAVQESRLVPASDTQPVAALPLMARGGEIIGALGIYSDPQKPLSFEEMAFIQQVSDQLAQALESARLFDQTQNTLAQTETLYQIGRLLNNANNVDEILEAVSLPGQKQGCNEATLMYFDLDAAGKPEWMTIVANWRKSGQPALAVGTRVYVPEFPSAALLMSSPQAPLLFSDASADEQIDPMLRAVLSQAQNRAFIVVPITQAGQWLGLLTFGWLEARTFTPADRETYGALSGLAAPSVQSRRLLIQAQTRAQREQSLRQITSAVRGSTDPTVIMRTAVREIGTVLGRKALIHLERSTFEKAPQAETPARENRPPADAGAH